MIDNDAPNKRLLKRLAKSLMKAILILGLSLCNCAYLLPAVALHSSQSDCPRITVEAPKDIEGRELIFKVKVSGRKLTDSTLTYKWSVYGGEMKEGQGTSSVTIVNFDLRGKSVTVVVEVGGLPAKCKSNSASCTISF
jgi:hypothetical protein